MLALFHRLIAALLLVLVASPACCCGTESSPRCCLPTDAESDSQPETPKERDNGGCGYCQCGDEISKPTEGRKLAPPREVGFNSLGDYVYQETCALPSPSPRDRRESLSGRHSTRVPIYQWYCAFLL